MSDDGLHALLARHLGEAGIDPATPPDPHAWQKLLRTLDARYRDTDVVRADADAAHAELRGALGVARAAERSEKGRAQFIANMSHELRTPLNAILGYGDMLIEELRDRPDGKALLDDVRRIERAGRTLLALINDLLDLARIDAGRMELTRERFEVEDALCGAVEDVPFAARGNRLEIEVSPDLGAITGDPDRVRQCVAVLVGNANRSSKDGLVRVYARREGPVIVVEVVDDGPGLTDDEQAVVFTEFSEATRRSDGAGLGLALVRRFVELMGGAIALRSFPGQGTTFTLRIPDHEGIPDEQAQAIAAQADRLQRGEGRIVLVIDDDPDVHDMVGRILGRSGFRVAGAVDGERGIALARRLRPAAVVLDLVLPGQSGWDVLSRLKGEPDLASIPVVVLSTLDDRRRGLALGADEFLVKPVERSSLLSAVRRHVARPDADVLVVDDDFSVRRALRTMLERAGLPVRTASNGQEALDRLKERCPGVIVLDLSMPVMDGGTFLAHLREDASYDQVAVVVMTAKDLSPQERAALEADVERVLSKQTASMEDLLRQVTELSR